MKIDLIPFLPSLKSSWYLNLLFSNVILSIVTNFLLWRTTSILFIGQLVFSFIFDFGAIATAFTSYNFTELTYSQKYKNEINKDNTDLINKILNFKGNNSIEKKLGIEKSENEENKDLATNEVIQLPAIKKETNFQ